MWRRPSGGFGDGRVVGGKQVVFLEVNLVLAEGGRVGGNGRNGTGGSTIASMN